MPKRYLKGFWETSGIAMINRIISASGLLTLVSIQILVGCAGVGKQLDPPRISLAQIQPQEFTGFEAVFQDRLRCQ